MDAFITVCCTLPSVAEEELPTLLLGVPILGVEIGERHGDRVVVTVYLPESEKTRVGDLASSLKSWGGEGLAVGSVRDRDWLAGYRESVRPFPVGGNWWVDPHPETPTPAPAGRRRLVMPPRMAFGSGSHESTRLILCALETAPLRGSIVLDVGTGSGILALAAETLGARRVVGVDVDAVAVQTAAQILRLQEWRSSVSYVIGSAGCAASGVFDVVLCNMITANFTPLMDEMVSALADDGLLVLSGLLISEIDSVDSELRLRGLKTTATATLGEWASLKAGRRS